MSPQQQQSYLPHPLALHPIQENWETERAMEERRDTEQMGGGEEAEEMKGETWGDVETHTERNKMRKQS